MRMDIVFLSNIRNASEYIPNTPLDPCAGLPFPGKLPPAKGIPG